ncbi:MAG: crotonase/enoyl-CoA hydratase family protein [Thioalkalispiraceae bacterium]|jgi:DSF synthase
MSVQDGHYIDLQFTESFSELRVHYDEELQAIWAYMRGSPRPCFTPTLLKEIIGLNTRVKLMGGIKYVIGASDVPQVYNLGGDLNLFFQYIQEGKREKLRQYAYDCVECGYSNATQINHGITTIALVQGSALGGGFEGALSSNVVVVEENAKLGFPEILFNLFPGMGAYTFLSRRMPVSQVEKMVLSGEQYSGADLYEMGAVDILAKEGEGEKAVREFIAGHRAQRRARIAIHQARNRLNPITIEELRDIADIWVEAAMDINEESLRVMERLVRAQDRKLATKKLVASVANA